MDYATIKYGPNGGILWTMRYNGPADSGDVAFAIVVDDSENVYVTGTSEGVGTYLDYATIKYVQGPGVGESYKEKEISFSVMQNPVFCNNIVVALHNVNEREETIIDLYDVCGRLVKQLFSGIPKERMKFSVEGLASDV